MSAGRVSHSILQNNANRSGIIRARIMMVSARALRSYTVGGIPTRSVVTSGDAAGLRQGHIARQGLGRRDRRYDRRDLFCGADLLFEQ
jgi:hypothetical protein